MPVDPKDREAYEQGKSDANDSLIDGLFKGFEVFIPGPGRSESEEAAYQKGKNGEQLDEDD